MRHSLVIAKQPVGCDKTTRRSCDFKGHFSDFFPRNFYSVPRNLFFFPRDFENVRRNSIFDGRNRGKLREIRGKIEENQEKVGEN